MRLPRITAAVLSPVLSHLLPTALSESLEIPNKFPGSGYISINITTSKNSHQDPLMRDDSVTSMPNDSNMLHAHLTRSYLLSPAQDLTRHLAVRTVLQQVHLFSILMS